MNKITKKSKETLFKQIPMGSVINMILGFFTERLSKNIMSKTKPINILKDITVKSEKDKTFILEQYRILVEVINKNNENRENLNNFWITLNGTIFAAIAYVKDMQIDNPNPKSLFIWVLWGFGIIMSFIWVRALSSIKNNIDLRNAILIEMEKYLPAKIFTTTLIETGRIRGENSLSSTERTIPIFFCIGYVILGTTLLLYPNIVRL